MTLQEYGVLAMSTCLNTSNNDVYALNGLTAEVGEIHDKVAKWVRKGLVEIQDNNICVVAPDVFADDGIDPSRELLKECGDVLWFVNLLCIRLGSSLEEVAQMNVSKLASRQRRGVIDGNGDNR